MIRGWGGIGAWGVKRPDVGADEMMKVYATGSVLGRILGTPEPWRTRDAGRVADGEGLAVLLIEGTGVKVRGLGNRGWMGCEEVRL